MPDQPVMKALAAGGRDRFLEAEAAARRQAGLPPFGRLAALIISAGDAETCDFTAAPSPRRRGCRASTVLGPAPAPLAILRGRHRRRFLVKAGREGASRRWFATGSPASTSAARPASRSTSTPTAFSRTTISREPGKETGNHSILASEPSIPSNISSPYQSLAP
jgi:hypothetical protein